MASQNFPKLPGYAPTHDPTLIQNKKISHVHLHKVRNSKDQPVPLHAVPRPAQGNFAPPKAAQSMSVSHVQYPNHAGTGDIQAQFEPTYVKLDKQVLRFYGYFKEHVVESRLENARVRHVTIFYYLEDKSIMITEPKQVNSGVPQGPFLKRLVYLKPDGCPMMPDDFNLQADVEINARKFRLFSADDYTHQFFQRQGIHLGENEPAPVDNFAKSQVPVPPKKDPSLKQFMEKSLGGGKVESQKQFLDKDRQVLRFFTTCQDLPYTVHYYLADDTFEIRECHYPNDGRDAFAVLLRRSRLPDRYDVNQPGQAFIGDNYLTCDEITPTSNINAYGSVYVVNGVDPFTQKFYMDNYGYDFPISQTRFADPAEPMQPLVPPYNGFGDEQDSLGQMHKLVPQRPKKDFFKVMNNDKKLLRFTARFNTRVPEDKDRRFIITFYLSDDSISIYEIAQKNSGIIEGKFLHKRRYKNVDNNNEFLTLTDLGIGSDVKINGHSFHCLSADDYTTKYLQQYLM